MTIMLALLGLASIGYGVTVMAIHSGTSFFVVWYALGALLLATAEALRSGAWRLLPPAVLRGGAALLVCLALTLAAGPLDLVSLSTGEMAKRYGFIYVDMDDEGKGTMARSRKDSFYWYKKVIASNGTDLDDSFEK